MSGCHRLKPAEYGCLCPMRAASDRNAPVHGELELVVLAEDDHPAVRCPSFTVNDKMVAAAGRDGDLLVRIAPHRP